MLTKFFWFFKSAIYAFMRFFIKAIPVICLVAVVGCCWDCIKYKQVELFDIVLIVLNLVGFIIYTYVIFQDYFLKVFNRLKKVEEKVFSTILYIGVFCYICLCVCGYLNIINIFRDFPYLIGVMVVLTTLSLLLYFFKNRFLPYSTPTSLIIYRITLLVFITISSLLYTLLSIKSCFIDAGIYSYCSLMVAMSSLWFVYLEFYHNFVYINYKRPQYLLFLRNFSMDNRIREAHLLSDLEGICNELRLFLMRIGNPRTMLDFSAGKTFYLKTINWKDQLHDHIEDAKIVLSVISNSDGLFWEIFNHVQYLSKFIYHILDISKMRDDLRDGKYDRIKHTKLGGILYFVSMAYGGPFAYCEGGGFCVSFTFNDSNLIISCSVEHIIKYMLDPNNPEVAKHVHVIELEYNEEFKKEQICYQDTKYLFNSTMVL